MQQLKDSQLSSRFQGRQPRCAFHSESSVHWRLHWRWFVSWLIQANCRQVEHCVLSILLALCGHSRSHLALIGLKSGQCRTFCQWCELPPLAPVGNLGAIGDGALAVPWLCPVAQIEPILDPLALVWLCHCTIIMSSCSCICGGSQKTQVQVQSPKGWNRWFKATEPSKICGKGSKFLSLTCPSHSILHPHATSVPVSTDSVSMVSIILRHWGAY